MTENLRDIPTAFVIDDDDDARESVCALIASAGMSARAFPSAESFLKVYEPMMAGCVITDFKMPGMNGVQLLERIAAEKFPLPVVIISGHADVPITVKAFKHGALTLLEKPCSEHQLLSAIQDGFRLDARRREEAEFHHRVQTRLDSLSAEEHAVLKQLVAGKANKNIVRELDIGLRTVERRRRAILDKMQVDSIPELVALVTRWEERH